MNKSEFVTFIAEKYSITKVDAEKSLNVIVESITEALSKGKEINLVGFGSFKVQKRPARDGRNPKTGAPLKIKASKLPVFKAGKGLKDSCN
ncbi:MAG: HU family DNA-binding protein [Rickettsiaceae bacterium]|nr:HU family DNA-binding protein [Rickettsiaceae bacterium]